MRFAFILVGVLFAAPCPPVRAETVKDLVRAAQEAFGRGNTQEAITLAGKAIQLDPKNTKGYFTRAAIFAGMRKHKQALADYTMVIRLAPRTVEAYSLRGAEHFKLGRIKASIADFDMQIRLKPGDKAGHWRRGISCYYAARYDDGRKQFEGYEEVDTNDVENAVWHFLCLARAAGVAKARQAILKIGNDKRVPMMQVYALYAGKVKPADVLAAAEKTPKGAKAELVKQQLFYAHLYLGLYYEVTGNPKLARAHMSKAARDYVIGHYMGDVARVHLTLMEKNGKPK